MLTAVLDVLAVVLLALGSITMTISVYGVLRMPDVYTQLHAIAGAAHRRHPTRPAASREPAPSVE
jgi:multisubunit Na+/H+ antiporter MnhG subunit